MTTLEKKYIFVDLDGTFAKNDLFQELLVKRFCQKPIDTLLYVFGEVEHQFNPYIVRYA